ncbi:aminotransferase class V-fold PLP-dependent enzyme [Phaeacidiphilus oryzae]|uniref:aminotransferase class V-fold PLP-dependent enzyme n=1 Tax=Phaeacidiphilus oryzae TaxID=348818 RepID=UPI00055DC9C5|nr:aminotransferase class V-fold PLP-dependent enzyme [Phaeacidiphilus oryzae]
MPESSDILPGFVRDQFAPETAYLNTASYGLPPARSFDAVRAALDTWQSGRGAPISRDPQIVAEARSRFAGLLGARAADTAIGSTASALIAPIAAALPGGAEVLCAQGEFASAVQAFHSRGDLAVRTVPLERLAESVRDSTALVTVSVVQSADGRVTDLRALHAVCRERGARLLVDATQAAGWLPLDAADADYWVCGCFKWLLGARSVGFCVLDGTAAREDGLRPVGPGWYSAEDPWANTYDAVEQAADARRFDSTPDWLGCVATAESLAFLAEVGIDRINRHDLALAREFREAATDLGYKPVAENASAIVSLPGAPPLASPSVVTSHRAGALRVSFHVFNTREDVRSAIAALRASTG